MDDIKRVLCISVRFQHFVKSDDAGAALSALDDSEFMGSHIQVQVRKVLAAVCPVFESTAIFMCLLSIVFFAYSCPLCDMISSR